MSLTKILKNNTAQTTQILNRDVLANESYDVPYGQFAKLADSLEIRNKVISEEIIVNNGTSDLSVSSALTYLKLMEAPSPGLGVSLVDEILEIPINRQMVVYQEIEIPLNQEATIYGELILME